MDMTEEEFAAIAAEEWDAVPAHVAQLVKNVALLIEDMPDAETREERELGEDDSLLGIYRGVPRTEKGEGSSGELPDTITLYRFPILDESLALEETPNEAVRMVIRETIWHELGHHFGFGEEEVQVREDEGTNSF